MDTNASYSLGDKDHPKLVELLRFWEARRGVRVMPARSEISVVELGPWLGNLILLEPAANGEDFIYRVYGTNLATLIRHDMTKKSTADLKPATRATVNAEYRVVVEHRRPYYISRRRTVISGQAVVSKLILPFSEDGVTVDRVLAGVYPLKIDENAFEPEWLGGLVDTEVRLQAEAV
jgi:hypothetical protein